MAQPVHFPEANLILQKPADMTDEECQPLPVFTDGAVCISRWALSPEEIEEVKRTGHVYAWVWSGQSQPPICVATEQPFADGEAESTVATKHRG